MAIYELLLIQILLLMSVYGYHSLKIKEVFVRFTSEYQEIEFPKVFVLIISPITYPDIINCIHRYLVVAKFSDRDLYQPLLIVCISFFFLKKGICYHFHSFFERTKSNRTCRMYCPKFVQKIWFVDLRDTNLIHS